MAQQSIILAAGTSIVLPAGARIDSYIVEDGATLTSSCGIVPNGDTYECYRYDFAESNAGGALADGEIESIEIGGTVYPIGLAFPMSATSLRDTINAIMGPLFVVHSAAVDTGFADRVEYAIGVKIPSLLVSSVKFKIVGTSFPGMYIIPTAMDDCNTCVDTTTGGNATDTVCDIV